MDGPLLNDSCHIVSSQRKNIRGWLQPVLGRETLGLLRPFVFGVEALAGHLAGGGRRHRVLRGAAQAVAAVLWHRGRPPAGSGQASSVGRGAAGKEWL